MSRLCHVLCSCLCMLSTVGGMFLLALWLTATKHHPTFHLADFSITNASRHSRSGLANLPVRFTVTDHNPNKMIGIYYKEMSASVYFRDELISSGKVMQPSFYQAPKHDTAVQGALTASGPVRTDPAWEWFADELSAGSVAIQLFLDSRFRFKWYPKKHHVKVECDFRLGGDGALQQQYKNSKCQV